MEVNGEEGLEYEIRVNEIRLEHVSQFKYLCCGFDESGTDDEKCRKKAASGRKVAGAFRSQVNTRDLQFECTRVLHEALLVPVFMYSIIWKEEERSRIRDSR